MASESSRDDGEFLLQERPVLAVDESDRQAAPVVQNFDDLGELPQSYGVPMLVAIARDPATLFAYWELDWPQVFGDSPPTDRAVHLRVLASDGTSVSSTSVEPLAGSCYIPVDEPGADYRVEIGYYRPAGEWHSVAISERVITPRDSVAEDSEFQLVTVPLHLNFQRLVDIFRGSKFDGQALTEALGNLQQRVEASTADPMPREQRELLATIKSTLSDAETERHGEFRDADDPPISRARLERVLGFGSTSPSNGFAGGS